MLGELLASQLHFYIVKNILKLDSDETVSYVNQKLAGNYLKNRLFVSGTKYPWNEMIQKATGETLAPKYFVQQFIEK